MTDAFKGAVGVSISGTDTDAVHATTAVIAHALESKGFSNVQVTNLDQVVRGEKSTTLQSHANLLDTMRAAKPHLFAIPISVTHSSSMQSDDGNELNSVDRLILESSVAQEYAEDQAAAAKSLESSRQHTNDALASLAAHRAAHEQAVDDASQEVVFELSPEEVKQIVED